MEKAEEDEDPGWMGKQRIVLSENTESSSPFALSALSFSARSRDFSEDRGGKEEKDRAEAGGGGEIRDGTLQR